MSRYEYALTSLPNFTMAKIAGPLYVLSDHFSAGTKDERSNPMAHTVLLSIATLAIPNLSLNKSATNANG
jgi:hypothetical protein